jgi:uncharacterized protein (TIGR02001 family)
MGLWEYALFRRGVVVAALAGACALACPSHAAAQWRAHGNVGIVSDYVYRGYSRSEGEPALQANLQTSNRQLTVGVWASAVRLQPRRLSTEFNLYAHWQQPLSDAVTAGFTATYYRFPGDPRPVSYNYAEFSAELDWRQRWHFELAWSPSVTLYAPYYGPQGAQQSWSSELTWSQPLRWGLMAFAGIGRFDAPQLRHAAYNYGSIGISRDLGRWHGELSYIRASSGVGRLYQLGPAGGPLVASVAWHF